VVNAEIAALNAAGVRVETYVRSSDELDDMNPLASRIASLSAFTGGSSRKDFCALLEKVQPDIVHLHNPYPLVSPRVIEWSNERRIPVVASIHNYRLQCMNGLLFRNGKICTQCENTRLPWPGVVHSCYRDSTVASAIMGSALAIHHKRWEKVSRFIAVSHFVADRLQTWGIDPERIVVKANPVADPGEFSPPGEGFFFAGRLSEEKGVVLLLEAWQKSGLSSSSRLVIAGDGPLRDFVHERASSNPSICFLGPVTTNEAKELRRQCAVGVLPSMWFEPHSSITDFFAAGRPVIGTTIGGLAELIDESVGWTSGLHVLDLAETLVKATDRPQIELRGRSARQRFENLHAGSTTASQLIDIYQSVLSSRHPI
jgi:glycosyltransferase involved in cell wall biosynthesis